jgi:hypothetical protein
MIRSKLVIAELTLKEQFAMTPSALTLRVASSAIKSRTIGALVMFAVVGWTALTGYARAQDIGGTTFIGASSGLNLTGSLSINQVTGVGNQQNNSSIVTDVPGQLTINQSSIGEFITDVYSGSTIIGDHAFTQASGLVQVSQTSGAGNIAANAEFVGIGDTGNAVNAISLSQLRSGFAEPDPNSPQFDALNSISPTAFAGSSGLIQVQQTAGNNNVAANTMAVHMDASMTH